MPTSKPAKPTITTEIISRHLMGPEGRNQSLVRCLLELVVLIMHCDHKATKDEHAVLRQLIGEVPWVGPEPLSGVLGGMVYAVKRFGHDVTWVASRIESIALGIPDPEDRNRAVALGLAMAAADGQLVDREVGIVNQLLERFGRNEHPGLEAK